MPPKNDLMDADDRRLLNRIQSDFPVTAQPYQTIGQEIGMSEAEVIARVRRLKAKGLIRRIGGNFSPEKLGFVSTLCAARVPADDVDRFAGIVNRYPGVTHNYLRENSFNVWFTFIAPSMEEIEANLAAIRDATGVDVIMNLPATRVFKIRAKFDV
ncbi:MAG: AsnC family transcriptional regulator [Desulfobacterales bacterium]|nr:AsnC family transcriptional regulator [Desulfobacterales bacterium]MDJ0853563.1 AsnC family transcriptional regulator [Desulfobacterales bacterium]MDJ0886490.1 AsnC family transcriptional regulator [Desulfobacterales bacterium]MDJ0991862.1 AsnC family transcriptional regulator [Desulfobacterales bacterium]